MKSLLQFLTESLLLEGGAAGHMLHPYELPFIYSGDDLIRWFTELEDKLRQNITSTFVKLDGVNCAIRVRNGEEFVLDRLTKDPMDIAGMSVQDIMKRYGGHEYGYDRHASAVVNAFNECFSTIKPELKKLGLIDNSNIMFNIEYIDKDRNIISTGKHTIAIHGLLMIEQTKTGARRSYEVRGDQGVLDKIAQKMTKNLKDIEVITQEVAFMDGHVNIKRVLQTPMGVNFGDRKETKSLREWLNEYVLTERKNCSVKTLMGKRVTTQSLQVMRHLYSGGDISEWFATKDQDIVLKNYFLQIATLMIGQEFLNNMNSRIGHLSKQEGVVIRDAELNKMDAPVKLTGYFVLHK